MIIPAEFVSIQSLGFECSNYYFNGGGKAIGITRQELAECGLPDERMWCHPYLARKLQMLEDLLDRDGLSIVAKDALRPVSLYRLIAQKRREKNLPVEGLINEKDMPHATGLAIDISIKSRDTGEDIWIYNRKRDGDGSIRHGFYKDHPVSPEYHERQRLLIERFRQVRMELGSFNEVWHFQCVTLNKRTPRI